MNDGFYTSIDKLVAFGMNNSLATSMMQTINQAMANMQMPDYAKNNKIDMTSQVTPTAVDTKRFFAAVDDKAIGPLTKNELLQMMANREVTKETLVWYHELPGWAKAGDLSELVLMFNQIPPQL